MKEKYNLAFWGAGSMASVIVDTVDKIERFNKYAVASRNFEKSVAFAQEHGVLKALTYEELLSDKKIDLVYISTPTKFHYEHIKQCLLAGKNVICEKPLVETEQEATELFELSEKYNLLLLDGLWTMYMPIIERLCDLVKEIGNIKYASASLGWPSKKKSKDGDIRFIYDLWDYEVYPLAIMHALFGVPENIKSISKEKYTKTIENKSFLSFPGFKSRIFSSLKRRGTYCLVVVGAKGLIICRKYWMGRYPIFVYKFPFSIKKIDMKHKYSGYEYELLAAAECLDEGKIQSELFLHKKTIELMKSKDQLSI